MVSSVHTNLPGRLVADCFALLLAWPFSLAAVAAPATPAAPDLPALALASADGQYRRQRE